MRSWWPFVLLTVLSWGTYIPTLHKGQLALGGSGLHAFLMVGVAYLLVAILIPGTMIAKAGTWHLFTSGGMTFTIAAGVLGYFGYAYYALLRGRTQHRRGGKLTPQSTGSSVKTSAG
jgi:hypothetical protein